MSGSKGIPRRRRGMPLLYFEGAVRAHFAYL